MLKKYTEEEIKFIKESYLKLSCQEISIILSRSIQGINTKINKLGLRKKKYNYTNNCIFCSKKIGIKYKDNPNILYCSDLCNKRSSLLNRRPSVKSHYNSYKNFLTTETGKGRYWEKFVAEKLDANLMPFCHPYDVEYNRVTIDVKSATGYQRKFSRGKAVNPEKQQIVFTFNKNEGKPKKVGYLLLIAFSSSNTILNSWLIPYSLVGFHLCISQNSKKYKQYEINFNNIEDIKLKLNCKLPLLLVR